MCRKRYLILGLLMLSSPALAGSADEPEIEDDQGDVRAQYIVDTGELEGSDLTPEEASRLGDVLSAWVHGETDRSFSITVQLGDIPDDENLSTPLAEVWTHFEVKSDAYHALAALSAPSNSDGVQARYELHRGSSELGEISGLVDADADTVTFRIPKEMVRNPDVGDELERFHVTTHLPEKGPVLDYAPRADPMTLEEAYLDPLDPTLGPSLGFGAPYAFGQYEGAIPSQITVQVTPSNLQVESGSTGTFAVTVKNTAAAEDKVTLTLEDVPRGWSARVEDASMTIGSGEAELTRLHVTAPSDAKGTSLITLHVTSELGADEPAPASVTAIAPPPGQDEADNDDDPPEPVDPGAGSSDTQEQDAQAGDAAGGEDENGAPMPSALLLVSALAGIALLARDRKRT